MEVIEIVNIESALLTRELSFLPYTIHFELQDDERAQNEAQIDQLTKQTSALTFFSQNSLPTIQNTDGSGAETNGNFFSTSSPKGPLSRLPSIAAGLNNLAGITPNGPNEPHSPAWGRTEYFTQPHLRADEAPKSSLSEQERAPRRHRAASSIGKLHQSNSRDSSHERALQKAEWVIHAGEQGNGGLRNAVYAATKNGTLEHVTWVSNLFDVD